MRAIAYQQLAPTTAIGLGFANAPTAAAYNAGTSYAVADCVTYGGFTWACIKAGTGQTPTATRSLYWVKVDSTYGIPTEAVYALINVEGQTIRLRDDGNAATASIGELIGFNAATLPTSELMYDRGPLWRVSIIQTAGTAKVNCTYYSN